MANPWASPAASASTAASPFQMPNLFGAGDGGFPGMGGAGTNLGGGAFPGMPNPEVMNSMMQDPSMQAVMNSMMSNPDFMEMVFLLSFFFMRAFNERFPSLCEGLQYEPADAAPARLKPNDAPDDPEPGLPSVHEFHDAPTTWRSAPCSEHSSARARQPVWCLWRRWRRRRVPRAVLDVYPSACGRCCSGCLSINRGHNSYPNTGRV